MQIDKLLAYAAQDPDLTVLTAALDGLLVPMADALIGIENTEPAARAAVLATAECVAPLLQKVGCRMIQAIALGAFEATTRGDRLGQLTGILGELAAVAAPFDLKLGIEPVCFSPFRSMSEALDLVAVLGEARAGLVLDTWHLWTSGTDWQSVADLDPAVIACAHLGDGRPKAVLSGLAPEARFVSV